MKKRLYPWLVFGVLVIIMAFLSTKGGLANINIWFLIVLILAIVLALVIGVFKK